MIPDIDDVIQIIRETAAREVMPRFGNLAAGDVTKKTNGEVVTTADIAAEKRLAHHLKALAPESVVVGEEAADSDPSLMAALAGPQPVWLVDPVDGTRNFSQGEPCFAIIVAFCQGGATVAGWINDPINDLTVWAAVGKGAWLGRRRLKAAATADVGEMAGSLRQRMKKRLQARAQAGLGAAPARIVHYRCTGREYQDLALGKLHFCHYPRRLKPWDHAAGVLMHREAVGFSALPGGRRPYRPAASVGDDKDLLLAPDEAAWDALDAALAAPYVSHHI